MFSGIISWIKSLFVRDNVGIILKLLAKNAAKTLAKEIFNKENQQKAYEFVKQLEADETLTGIQKAKEFNLMMAQWALKTGKVLANSVINCLRELAVNAIKDELLTSESEEGEQK